MINRTRSRLTGLIAIAALIALVIGLPVVLYRFGGSPLPHRIATWHRIITVLTSQDNGSVLLSIVRDVSWLAWLAFAVSILAEVQATVRGSTAPRLRLGGIQGSAARLVALAALTFTAPPAITLTASVAAVPAVHLPTANAESQTTAPQAAPTMALASLDTVAASRTITVHRGDCLWTIAQHYLGAGDRYPEIVSMNYGHDMGDGQVFINPSLIQPGWRLVLPSGDSPDGAGHAAERSARHIGHATHDPRFRRQHSAAGLRPATGQHDATGQAAGQHGATGHHGAASQHGVPSSAEPSQGATGNSAYQTSADMAASAGDHLPAAAVFAAGALAGAVLTTLGRLRRRQRQYRRRGRRIALPADAKVLATEQRLRAAAPTDSPSTLRDALSLLESGITGAGHVLPDIVGLHVTPGVLEVLLAAPALDSPPAPYSISPGRQGMCWHLPLAGDDGQAGPAASPESRAADSRGSGLLPGLFTAGATEEGYLLLDLESLQVTGCDGPPELVDEVITASATELATGQWSGWYELILVGFGELEVLGRAEHCATVDAAISLLEMRCLALRRRLGDDASADVRELRLASPDDEDWGLTILVSRFEPEPDEIARLLELAEDGPGGIAALVAGDPESPDGRMAPTALQLAPDPQRPEQILANVIPLQISVRPQTLSDADYQAIGTLFATATDLEDVSQVHAPYEVYAAPPWIPQAASMEPQTPDDPAGAAVLTKERWDAGAELDEADDTQATDGYPDAGEYLARHGYEEPAWHHASEFTTPADGVPAPWVGIAGPPAHVQQVPRRLEVKILGPFAITGAADQLQPKQAELVLALALATPGGLTNSALCCMLGADADHPKPADAVRQVITRTRRRLGTASDGQEYIVHTGNGNYVLHPEVSLDWTDFRNLVATAKADDMRAALSMVRGQPFTGSYHWWIDIPLLETVRAEIVDAAETLAEYELATGEARAAARAARAGLAAETAAEQLWRLLMRAEHAAGNLGGVREAWRRCLDAIEDIAPGGEPHPDTEALYRQLTTGTRQQAPARG
jgi:DNA-binding SARP family transcriptional activator